MKNYLQDLRNSNIMCARARVLVKRNLLYYLKKLKCKYIIYKIHRYYYLKFTYLLKFIHIHT
jgi:hypothetical protein